MVSHRQKRVADLIQRELAGLLQREAQDPRFAQVSITGVEISADLQNAKIYFSVLGDDAAVKEVTQALEKASGYFRTALASRIELRHAPRLIFRFDNSLNEGDHIERLLRQIAKEDRAEEESEQ
jgi:ribosome-binding factor A